MAVQVSVSETGEGFAPEDLPYVFDRFYRGDRSRTLECPAKANIPFGASLMIGAPGETPETVAESLTLLDNYAIPLGTWITVGLCLWTSLAGHRRSVAG